MGGEAKFTPGPWKAVRNSSYWQINSLHPDFMGQQVGDACTSSWMRKGGLDSPLESHEEANAHLIAAAPDLMSFATLVAGLETSSDFDDRTGESMSGDDAIESLDSLIRMARSRVKATSLSLTPDPDAQREAREDGRVER